MRKTMTGVVVSDKMQQTAVVAVTTQKIHPIIKKRYHRAQRFMAHNPDNTYVVGDQVTIAETRPQSKNKRWEIVSKVAKAAEGA